MTHHWILLTFSEDSRIWTFSVTVSAALVAFVWLAVWRILVRRRNDTSRRRDTS
jgi:hypothetical protein